MHGHACCEMGEDVYMYGRAASSGNESMNNANLVVPTIILMDLASVRYKNKKKVAWMDRDKQKREEAFKNVYVHNYCFQVQELDDHWLIQVRNVKEHTVVIMKEPGTHRSRFGTCTYGTHKVLGALCEHMVAAVKIGQVPDWTEENVMPYWWTVA